MSKGSEVSTFLGQTVNFESIYIRHVAYMTFKFLFKEDVSLGEQPLVTFLLKPLLCLRGVEQWIPLLL